MKVTTAAIRWRVSSYSGHNGACVEAGCLDGNWAAVRDSKQPEGPAIALGPDMWQAFVVGVRAGAYDRA